MFYSMNWKKTVFFITLLTSAAILLHFILKSKPYINSITRFKNHSTDKLTTALQYNKSQLKTFEPYFLSWKFSDNISCHYIDDGDALLSIKDMKPPNNSIFFHETTCRGGLDQRQACCIETVARLHPQRNIYVLFNSPVARIVLTRSSLAILSELKNVYFARVHAAEYAKGTALENMFARREIDNRSKFKVEHTADILRYITMYKYGGIYLDTDMLVVKRLDPLGTDWVARENNEFINVAAFAISKGGIGHLIVSHIITDISSSYRPLDWSTNGAGAMQRELLKICNAKNLTEVNTSRCLGFRIHDPAKIYPVYYGDLSLYFKPGVLSSKRKRRAYMHHLWNKLSHYESIKRNSPYDRLTRKHCPSVREMYGKNFGKLFKYFS